MQRQAAEFDVVDIHVLARIEGRPMFSQSFREITVGLADVRQDVVEEQLVNTWCPVYFLQTLKRQRCRHQLLEFSDQLVKHGDRKVEVELVEEPFWHGSDRTRPYVENPSVAIGTGTDPQVFVGALVT